MKIWWLDYHPAFNTLKFIHSDDFSAFENFKFGVSLKENWIPLKMSYHDVGRHSDFVYRLNGALFVSDKAKEMIDSFVSKNDIEFLPVHTNEGEYYTLNVLNVLDCIDENKSVEDRLPSGKLVGYKEMEFICDAVKDQPIFRVKMPQNDTILTEIFVSDQVRNLILDSDLKGYQLTDIWDSEMTQAEIEIKLNVMGETINTKLYATFDFNKALQLLDKHGDVICYSGRSSVKHDENGNLEIGFLQLDGSYIWVEPYAIPPAFYAMEWGVKQKMKGDGLFGKFKKMITRS